MITSDKTRFKDQSTRTKNIKNNKGKNNLRYVGMLNLRIVKQSLVAV